MLLLKDPKSLQLLDVIGQGGFGTVYKALWMGTIVAAKLVPLQIDATTTEAEILKYDN